MKDGDGDGDVDGTWNMEHEYNREMVDSTLSMWLFTGREWKQGLPCVRILMFMVPLYRLKRFFLSHHDFNCRSSCLEMVEHRRIYIF